MAFEGKGEYIPGDWCTFAELQLNVEQEQMKN